MTVGLRIFNDAGISQISDMHHNMVMVGKGTVQNTNPNAYGQFVEFSHDGPVMFAVSAPLGGTAIVYDKTGTTYKFAVLFGDPYQTHTWYAFSYPKNIPTTIGLRVFNETGSLVYDAAQKPLRMAHYSSQWVPGVPPIQGSVNQIPQSVSPPPDIYIPQQRSNRTYASMGINMIGYRKVKKKWEPQLNGWLLGWAMFYYFPVSHADGIRLQAREVCFSAASNTWPLGTMPYGQYTIYEADEIVEGTPKKWFWYQNSWIIDVTDY